MANPLTFHGRLRNSGLCLSESSWLRGCCGSTVVAAGNAVSPWDVRLPSNEKCVRGPTQWLPNRPYLGRPALAIPRHPPPSPAIPLPHFVAAQATKWSFEEASERLGEKWSSRGFAGDFMGFHRLCLGVFSWLLMGFHSGLQGFLWLCYLCL